MYRLCQNAHDGCCPASSPEFVYHHLRFIDHGTFVLCLKIQHIDRRCLKYSTFAVQFLFSGHQITAIPLPGDPLILFKCQKPQRPEIDPAARLHQRLHGMIRLSGVSWPDMQYKPTLQDTGRRIEIHDIIRYVIHHRHPFAVCCHLFRRKIPAPFGRHPLNPFTVLIIKSRILR